MIECIPVYTANSSSDGSSLAPLLYDFEAQHASTTNFAHWRFIPTSEWRPYQHFPKIFRGTFQWAAETHKDATHRQVSSSLQKYWPSNVIQWILLWTNFTFDVMDSSSSTSAWYSMTGSSSPSNGITSKFWTSSTADIRVWTTKSPKKHPWILAYLAFGDGFSKWPDMFQTSLPRQSNSLGKRLPAMLIHTR